MTSLYKATKQVLYSGSRENMVTSLRITWCKRLDLVGIDEFCAAIFSRKSEFVLYTITVEKLIYIPSYIIYILLSSDLFCESKKRIVLYSRPFFQRDFNAWYTIYVAGYHTHKWYRQLQILKWLLVSEQYIFWLLTLSSDAHHTITLYVTSE